jgi:hypothetical protein
MQNNIKYVLFYFRSYAVSQYYRQNTVLKLAVPVKQISK